MRSGKRDDGFKLWLMSCLIFIIGGLGAGTLGVVWIYIEADFGVSLSALGAMLTAATIGRTITSSVSGPIIGRYGIAAVMMGGAGIGIFSQLGLALSPTWPMFMIAAIGHGFGSGVMGVGLNAFAAVNFSARRMNWLHGSFGIGSTIGPYFVTTVVIDLGIDWRWIYALFAATRALMLLMFFLTRHQWRIGEAKVKSAPNRMRQTMRLPIIWLMVGAWLMATGNELVAGQFSNSFFINARGIEPKTAAAWVSIYWASLTVSRFFSGLIITRISATSFMRLNNVIIMLGAGLLSANLSPLASLIGLALIGFAIAPFAPLMASDTPGLVGSAHTANAMGLQFTGASLGMALLPWLGGILAETVGLEVIPQFVFLIALITFLLYEGIVWRDIRRPVAKAL
ncbi:MAG: MFS transporter [Chloroflexota bacterium]|nr:MFS transporter [Chloroflexota bacterium]MDE2910425.1 MFS transporter [Chloroflexota bacterium]